MLVIVANEFDPHADAVILALKRKGFDQILRIDLESAHERFKIEIEPCSGAAVVQHKAFPDRAVFDVDDIRTIWWRRSSVHLNRQQLDLPNLENLDKVESYWALRWFIEAQPTSKFPLGHPAVMDRANNKFTQLKVAEELGFNTPRTLYTNSPRALERFTSEAGELVLKPLRSSLAYDSIEGKTVNFIARPASSDRLISAIAKEAADTAAFCQTRIRKRVDVRLNVFPSTTVACEIAAGELSDEEVDWRPKTNDYLHTIIGTPDHVERRCRMFIDKLGLTWGIFDFGVTPDDHWIFFECNPNAQWLWIEFKTGSPLSDIVADELLRHHSRKAEPTDANSFEGARSG